MLGVLNVKLNIGFNMKEIKFGNLGITNQKMIEATIWKERALKAEELIYDFISGKIDEKPLIEYVQESMNKL
jgi:hypothetical protein